jgi:hypothetical protein
MGNYVLTLHHTRCPDGAEFAPHPWVTGETWRYPNKRLKEGDRSVLPDGADPYPVIRFRSNRREDYRLRLETPDKLIVTEFLNTTPWVPAGDQDPNAEEWVADYSPMLKFISDYGFPLNFLDVERLNKEFSDGRAYAQIHPPRGEMSLALLIEIRQSLEMIWQAYEVGNVTKAVELFREHPEQGPLTGISPDIEFRGGKPALMLPVNSPLGFMLMETALVMTGGSQVMRCAKCGTIFVTGSGTGRRGTSIYCSNRCRVAAQRTKPEISQARPRSVPASRR